jgi:SEC-C motif
MKNIGRNDPCPCGSGKKFKKCHMGREDELFMDELAEAVPQDMGERIVKLPPVAYGRSQEMTEALDLQMLTGSSMGIKWVDLDNYISLNLSGGGPSRGRRGAVLINVQKTLKADPHNLYIAISRDVDEGTLVHQLAHVLDFLGGSKLLPGILEPLAYELSLPVEHLEHPEEFGYWMEFLVKKFEVSLDADDAIISYLYQHQLLIKGREIHDKNVFILKAKSDRILQYLSDHSEEVNTLIRDLRGYIGRRVADR